MAKYNMFKWLAISVTVLLIFLVILLALGYLLQQNEKTTSALKKQLSQERLARLKINQQLHRTPMANRTSNSLTTNLIDIERGNVSNSGKPVVQVDIKAADKILQIQQNIIAENLICVSDAQCVALVVGEKDSHCYVAINTIGASKLSSTDGLEMRLKSCEKKSTELLVKCLSNLCTMTNESSSDVQY